MRPPIVLLLIAPLLLPLTALGQSIGSVVDRNVSDAGPNSISQRVVDPGIARWSRDASMIDRFGNSDTQWIDRVADPRLNQRYFYQAPGLTALVSRPNYAVLTQDGQVATNRQGIDGKVIQLAPANLVYVLSPEYLNAPPTITEPDPDDHRVRGTLPANTGPVAHDARIDGRYDPNAPAEMVDIAAIHGRAQQTRHPDLVERSRRLREERAKEQATREAEEAASEEAVVTQPASDETEYVNRDQ